MLDYTLVLNTCLNPSWMDYESCQFILQSSISHIPNVCSIPILMDYKLGLDILLHDFTAILNDPSHEALHIRLIIKALFNHCECTPLEDVLLGLVLLREYGYARCLLGQLNTCLHTLSSTSLHFRSKLLDISQLQCL